MKHSLHKGLTFSAGLALKKLFAWPFDYVMYPAALVWLGSLWGGVAMTALAFIYNLGLIKAYDWSKVDWLMIESLKELRHRQPVTRIEKIVAWAVRRGDVIAFFLLCLDDPITVTLYLRHGSHKFNGMSRRDWKIFIAANIVSNLYWIIGWTMIIEIARHVAPF